MRTTVYLLISGLIILLSCKKDDFQYSFETPSKLLVAIKENDRVIFEFKYDSLNRMIRADRYFSGDPVSASEFYMYNSENKLISKTWGEYIESYEYNRNGSLETINLHFKSTVDGYDWDQKTELQYSKGRICKGIIYSRDDVKSGYFNYKYDSRGNTTERTEYSVSAEYKDMIISQARYIYDDKINPYLSSFSPFWGMRQADIVHGNNPVYSYNYSIFMSSLPPEFEISYDYDVTGLPLREYRVQQGGHGGSNVFEYEYIDKHE